MRFAFLADNVALLRQGRELLASLDARDYVRPDPKLGGSPVGTHVRHVLDFYVCFLRDLADGTIDYDDRPRDPRMETDLDHAVERFDALASQMERLDVDAANGIAVRARAAAGEKRTVDAPSSLERELQFLSSHTIHHYSLIAVLLRLADRDVPEEFGVAPSTLRHWKETRGRAG